jgi:hypothetical protein
VNPLERPETWDLNRFNEGPAVLVPGDGHPTTVEAGETDADRSRPR